MRPSQTILVLEDLRNSFSGPLYRKGIELTLDDTATVLDVYQQWLCLLVDLGYLHHGALLREAHRLFTDMVKRDVLDLNNAFADLLGCVRNQEIRGFKALCKRVSDHLHIIVKDDMSSVMLGDVFAAKRLCHAFAYTGRLTLSDIDLTQQCLEDYTNIEAEMVDVSRTPLISSLNYIIRDWMRSFDPTRIQFQHGPGGVAGHGRTSLEVKYKDLTSDKMLEYAFGEPWWVVGPVRSSLDRISQTIFVPKSYKTFRTISMESATLQYCQQGIWKEIDRVVSDSPFLRNRIGFHEQERNQRLARRGSIERNYATIDLSAASDSVSYSLVKELFRGTKLLRYLVATRSRRTLLPDGRLIELKKFAPMGSALCFPVETIIFASICAYVTRGHGVSGDFSVFGDDIIVPTQCVDQVMKILESLGFRVNREKSFYRSDSWFRESCGKEYCDGFDVTPLRVSRQFSHEQDFVKLASLIDLANGAYQHGYKTLRSFFLSQLRKRNYTPLFSPTGVLADNYTNYHTQRRWNFDLQKIECKTTSLHLTPSGDQNEDLRLRHWFESTLHRKDVVIDRSKPKRYRFSLREFGIPEPSLFESKIDKPAVKTKDCWRTKPYEVQDQDFIDWFVGRSI
jgi:hypothetical protein